MDNRRKNAPIFVILAAVVLIILIIAIGSGGGGREGIPIPDTTPTPGDAEVIGNLNPEQQIALDRLINESEEVPVVYAYDGVVRFLSSKVLIPDSAASSPQQKAEYFLSTYSDLFQVENISAQFNYLGSRIDSYGENHVRFEQSYQGVPVFGGDLIISVSQSDYIVSVNAGYIPKLTISTQPEITKTEAEGIALADIGPDGEVFEEASLVIFNEQVFNDVNNLGTYLAWHLLVSSESDSDIYIYIIDASTGSVLDSYPTIRTSQKRIIFDATGRTHLNLQGSTQVMDEKGPFGGQNPDEDAQNVWAHMDTVYDYFWDTFMWDSYDGKGSDMKTYVNVDCSRDAFWHPELDVMGFCDGINAFDIVAHEFTHGVTDSTSDLVYIDESGALDESYSDVFAAMMDTVNPWVVTWNTDGTDPLRNLGNPENPFPHHYDDLVHPGDEGCTTTKARRTKCVHTNSSIPSLAAYLLSEGGIKGGVTVQKIGKQKVERIYFLTLVYKLTGNANFVQARQATIQSCGSLIGHYGITRDDCEQIKNAFAAVGIGDPVKEKEETPQDGQTPEPEDEEEIISANTTTVLVVDSSGSMDAEDITGDTKMEAAIKAGSSILAVIENEAQMQDANVHQVGIVDFSTTARIAVDLTMDINAAQSELRQLYPTDLTGMASGLSTGMSMLDNDSSDALKIIILLSDGYPNVGLDGSGLDVPEAQAEVLQLASQAGKKGYCINTVGFGDPNYIDPDVGVPLIEEEFLKQVAANSGCGEYYNAQNAIELANIFVLLRHTSTGGEILVNKTGSISQGEDISVGEVEVAQNTSHIVYTLNWPGSQLNPVLIDPRNNPVTQSYNGASILISDFVASIVVTDPISGLWQVGAYGEDVPTGTTTYSAILSRRQSTAPSLPPSDRSPLGIVLILLVVSISGILIYTSAVKNKGRATALIRVQTGPLAGQVLIINDGDTIGRSPRCDLQIQDRKISRIHARLRKHGNEWFIQDQNSSLGTIVNGVSVSATKLYRGAQITLGNTTFIFDG